MKIAVWIVIGIVMFAVVLSGCLQPAQQKRVEIPIKNKIEREIKVKQLENKFIYVGLFSAAGGIGAPQIFTHNVSQFIELVPPKETVYVSFETTDKRYLFAAKNVHFPPNDYIERPFALKKIYWAFIENRAGLLVAVDEYRYSEGGNEFWVEEYTPEKVVFEWTNEYQ